MVSLVEVLLAVVGAMAVLLVVIVASSGGSLRRRIAIVGRDNRIRSEWVRPKHVESKNGHPFYVFHGAKYDWSGQWYEFEYRLVRSVGLRRYIGVQRIFLEGNPTPFRFQEDERMAALRGTAKALYDEGETDLPNRLLRPRRVDALLLILIGLLAFAVGIALGGRI